MTILLAANAVFFLTMLLVLIGGIRDSSLEADFFDYASCGILSAGFIANVARMLQ